MSHFRSEPGAKHTTRHSDQDDPHERQLVARLASNDRRALQRLYEIYLPRLTRFFNHVTTARNSHLIGYLVDETLISVWLARESVAGAASVYVRIMQLALRQARRYLYLPLPPSCPTIPSVGIPHDSAADTTSPLTMLGMLPLEQRVVAHFVYTGHSREQVAEILEVSCGDLDALLFEARAGLRSTREGRPGASGQNLMLNDSA